MSFDDGYVEPPDDSTRGVEYVPVATVELANPQRRMRNMTLFFLFIISLYAVKLIDVQIIHGPQYAKAAELATDKKLVFMAKVSLGKDDPLHKDKLMCARYWMQRMVPECPMLLERIQSGSAVIMELE